MKPTTKTADTQAENDAKPDAKAGSQAEAKTDPAASTIVERLKGIDVTSLDRLVSIRQEQKRVDDYRERAEEKKSAVSDAVYARVMEDYKKRSASLEEQSVPLRAQARDEYKKLKSLIDEVKQTEQRTRLEKDELEFRHSVGEFSDEHLAEKLKEPVRILEGCQSDQTAVNASKARFVEALGSEEALEAPEPPAPPKPVAAAAPPPPPAPPTPPAGAGTDKVPIVGKPSTHPPASPGATTPTGLSQEQVATAAARPAAAGKAAGRPADTEPAKTTVLLTAAILTSDAAAGRNEFLLGPLNEIGRAEENQIQIASSNLSRKHAVIRAVPGGFSITDLGSQNGTFVNGERVTERRLADGDTIELGSVRFVFRTPWPVTTHGAAAGGSARQSR